LELVDPLTAVIISFVFLGAMLYRRVALGMTLNLTAFLLALLSLEWCGIPNIVYASLNPLTLGGRLTISVLLATFGIMWLSQLYKETSFIKDLSESLSRLIRNSKVVLSMLPAVVGLLPVAGGALMSAPIVDAEAEKLGMKTERKAYVNMWFRHLIFPVYPLSQVLIITAALTGTTTASVILRQIPVVAVMIIAGYALSFWKISSVKNVNTNTGENHRGSSLRVFLKAFSPIMATIIVAICLDLVNYDLSRQGVDVLLATIAGLTVLAAISKANFRVLINPLRNRSVYDITLAAFGAFLLRNVMEASGISEVFKPIVANGNINVTLLLATIPTVFGFLTGSPSGGVAIGTSILAGILTFSPKAAALVYIMAYLGYVISPTHLCFTFTVDYFKTSLVKVYKYLIPSFLTTFASALLMYLMPF